MEPIRHSNDFIKAVGVIGGSLISAWAVLRLAQWDWTKGLFFSKRMQTLRGAVSWWLKPTSQEGAFPSKTLEKGVEDQKEVSSAQEMGQRLKPPGNPLRTALKEWVQSLEKEDFSDEKISLFIDLMDRHATLYVREDQVWIDALFCKHNASDKQKEGLYRFPYGVLLLFLKAFSFHQGARKKELIWQAILRHLKKDCSDPFLRYRQLRDERDRHQEADQLFPLSEGRANFTESWKTLQKAFFEKFLHEGGRVPFSNWPVEDTKAILNDLWNHAYLRKKLLENPYLVLRLLPYKDFLQTDAQALEQAWQEFWETETGEQAQLWIDFSSYSKGLLWKDGACQITPFTMRELKRLPRVANIIGHYFLQEYSELCGSNAIALFCQLALLHREAYFDRIGRLLEDKRDPCIELERWFTRASASLACQLVSRDGSALWKMALGWYVNYCGPYKEATLAEKNDLRSKALEEIDTHPNRVLVLLWLARKVQEAFTFCFKLFEENQTVPEQFSDFVHAAIFEKAIAKEKTGDGWKLCVAFYLRGRKVKTEAQIEKLSQEFSFEEKGAILHTVARLEGRQFDAKYLDWLHKKLPLSMKQYLLAYILHAKKLYPDAQVEIADLDMRGDTLHSILQESSLSIEQLFTLGTCTTSRLNHGHIILQLQKVALKPPKLFFPVQLSMSSLAVFPCVQEGLALPAEMALELLQFTSFQDYPNLCLISRSFYQIVQSQPYWKARCALDFEVSCLPSEQLWSFGYQMAYYFNRRIPAQFKRAMQPIELSSVTQIYALFALNEVQLKWGFSQKEVLKFSTLEGIHVSDHDFPVTYFSSLKRDQKKLLKFFEDLLLHSRDHVFDLKKSPSWWVLISALCVEESSLVSVVELTLQVQRESQNWSELAKKKLEHKKAAIKKGLLLRFGKALWDAEEKAKLRVKSD